MSLNLSLLLHESARAHAARPALHMGDMTLSYAQLQGMVKKFAGALRGLGVQPGQHVALLLPNTPHFPVSYFGILHAGNVVVPLNVLLTADEIAYHIEDSDSVVLVAWEGFAAQAIEAVGRVPTCKHLILVKASPTDPTAPDGCLSFNALLGSAKALPEYHPTMPDDRAVILYTSGTTGKPKGAELTHFNLFYNAEYVCRRLIPGDHSRVALAVLPLFHSFGQTAVQNATLALGGSLVLLPRFDAATAFALMQKHKVTLFAGVPTMYFGLLHYPEADKFDLSSLTICVSGGAAMPVEVMRAFDHKYRVNILEGFGLSETSPVASFNVLDRPKKAGSIGLPIWGVEFRLVDNDGKVVEGVGERGEIHIKGHNLMRGYYKRPEATADAIVDGWFKTGDIAQRDEEGYYYIVDRKKDMIIRGGFNVYPREIEEVLFGHPAIAEAAVIGVPHESHGEEVKAVVALKPGHSLSAEELIDYCKQHLAAYKYPRIVDFIASLPKGPTGKILKRELRG